MRRVLVILVVIAAVAAAWHFWPGEDRRVRSRLEVLAAELSIPPGEEDLARITRAAEVRSFFTEDVAIEVLEGKGLTIRGREEISGYVARLTVPPEGTRVELLNVDTQLGADRRAAEVRLNARVLSRARKDARPSVLDARMIALTLRKVEGDWLIANARIMPTDDSLGPR